MSEEENVEIPVTSEAAGEEIVQTAADPLDDASEQDEQTGEAAKTEEAPVSASVNAGKKKRKKYHAPLYIALCIFLAAVLFFGAKLCFFNTDIEGTWGFSVKGSEENDEIVFNLSFNDGTVRLQSAGAVYIGRLTIEDENGEPIRDESGSPVLTISMNLNGNPFVYKFNYEFGGDLISGRTLKLTDLSGMFLEPDKEGTDKETLEKHKKSTEYKENDGTTYYIWTLTQTEEKLMVKKDKNFKSDDKLIGSWLFKRDDDAYPYTLTFNKDGTFEQLTNEMEIYGTYSTDGDSLTLRYVQLGNNEAENTFGYSADGSKLKLKQEYGGYPVLDIELTKTKDKYSFKGAIS